MSDVPNRMELVGYMEEALPNEDMVRIEMRLRESESWRRELRLITEELGTGDHSVATIWRRHRLTCPSRERLAAFEQDGLLHEEADYIRFHLEVIGCRWCQANLEDVKHHVREEQDTPLEHKARCRKFFQTSVCFLPKDHA